MSTGSQAVAESILRRDPTTAYRLAKKPFGRGGFGVNMAPPFRAVLATLGIVDTLYPFSDFTTRLK